MKTIEKYQKLRKLCLKFNKNETELSEILHFLELKRYITIFYKGIYESKNPYSKNNSWSSFYWHLFNSGKLIKNKYLEKYEPKLF